MTIHGAMKTTRVKNDDEKHTTHHYLVKTHHTVVVMMARHREGITRGSGQICVPMVGLPRIANYRDLLIIFMVVVKMERLLEPVSMIHVIIFHSNRSIPSLIYMQKYQVY